MSLTRGSSSGNAPSPLSLNTVRGGHGHSRLGNMSGPSPTVNSPSYAPYLSLTDNTTSEDRTSNRTSAGTSLGGERRHPSLLSVKSSVSRVMSPHQSPAVQVPCHLAGTIRNRQGTLIVFLKHIEFATSQGHLEQCQISDLRSKILALVEVFRQERLLASLTGAVSDIRYQISALVEVLSQERLLASLKKLCQISDLRSQPWMSPSGLYLKPPGLYFKPSGLYLKPSGLYLKPSGLYLKPSGLYLKPSGLNLT
eukprot:gene10351-8287_t